ncbi:MAG: malto-oligosyltrehalose synthase [Acidimicrobiales bacterium]|nr:malto-oligosyltrehalose synthase [Acidimicrobiales bacterium]
METTAPEALDRPVPRATYRLQLSPDLHLHAAADLVPYLAELGVSHLYTSPLLQAAPGSSHGYDTVDPGQVSRELGGDTGFAVLADTAAERGLGLVVDVVPNHMAADPSHNPRWRDVLANGRASAFADWFDIDWQASVSKPRGRVLLPVLGDHYGRVLGSGGLQLVHRAGEITLAAGHLDLPLEPRSLAGVLGEAAATAPCEELAYLSRAFRRLPRALDTDHTAAAERRADLAVLQRRLAELLHHAEVAAAVDRALARVNGEPDALDEVLEQQHYRLAYWRTGGHELDYRRFFDVDTLIGVRVEDEAVYRATHERILGWVHDGRVQGLRIDHPDGLRDPGRYLERLRADAPRAWIVVEKILHPGEELPEAWPVDGTTGYDALRVVDGVFLDPSGADALRDLAAQLTGDDRSFEQVAYEGRRAVLRDLLGSELNQLTSRFVDVCEHERDYRDFSREELHEVLREVLACFGVYRTYVTEAGTATEADRTVIDAAMAAALANRPQLDPDLLGLLSRVLQGDRAVESQPASELRGRFQQLCGPVMAKGVEDTAFYRHVALLAANEVGGAPDRAPVDAAGFHTWAAARQRRLPRAMSARSTHDTKRSADVRVRLALLAQMPDTWGSTVRRWMALNDRHRAGDRPDRSTEYLLYQTLVACHPLPPDRVTTWLTKAMREAKVHTSWLRPDVDHERAVLDFATTVLDDARFRDELDAFVAPLLVPGRTAALAHLAVHLTAPGVPDLYQGDELWNLALVDPDNRRAVDWALRRSLLEQAATAPAETLSRALHDPDDPGLAKLAVVRRALDVRRSRSAAFASGSAYTALAPRGPSADAALGYARIHPTEPRRGIALVVPRLVLRTASGWGDTTIALPRGDWRGVFDARPWSGTVRLEDLLGAFPVALLEAEAS